MGNGRGKFFELSQTAAAAAAAAEEEEHFYNYQALKNVWKIESLKFQLLWAVEQRFGLPLGLGIKEWADVCDASHSGLLFQYCGTFCVNTSKSKCVVVLSIRLLRRHVLKTPAYR